MTINPGRSVSVAESRSSLMRAFQAVQRADSLGAPADQVATLSTQLNTALDYYNTAVERLSEGNTTGSEYYSTLSNTASTLVIDKAIALQGQAESNRTTEQIVAYGTAILASILSSFLVLEYHRIPNFIQRRKLLRTKLRQGDPGGQKN
jgi:predicted PurR-regulated permease PerM